MKISTASAQQIVEEIGGLVNQTINLMDHTGHIIASNDPARIGNFHPGAYEVVSKNIQELYITAQREYEDPLVRKGINLPIVVNGEVECVIGITGEYDEVIRYGQIVKKMAEILIRERIALDAQRLDQRIQTRFLEEWVLGDGLSEPQKLAERGYALGIDIRIPRNCAVVSPRTPEQYANSREGQVFIEQVEQVVNAHLPGNCIVLRNTGRQILLPPARSGREPEKLCKLLVAAVKKELGAELVCGFNGSAPDLHTSYLQANRAWRYANRPNRRIIGYDSLRTELILDEVSREKKLDYLRRMFPDCDAAQLREFVYLLDAWFAAEGSLASIAQSQFIHKNTIQYRLKRIAEITGMDVRKPSQAPALYLAVRFFTELDAEGGPLLF